MTEQFDRTKIEEISYREDDYTDKKKLAAEYKALLKAEIARENEEAQKHSA